MAFWTLAFWGLILVGQPCNWEAIPVTDVRHAEIRRISADYTKSKIKLLADIKITSPSIHSSLKYLKKCRNRIFKISTFFFLCSVIKKRKAKIFKLSRIDDLGCVQYGNTILDYSGISHTCVCVCLSCTRSESAKLTAWHTWGTVEGAESFLQPPGLCCIKKQLWFYFKLWNRGPRQRLENFFFLHSKGAERNQMRRFKSVVLKPKVSYINQY